MTDPSAVRASNPNAQVQIEWQSSGDLVVFAANRTAGAAGWYHGIRLVGAGSVGEENSNMLAVGLLE